MPDINKHIDQSKPYIKPNQYAHVGLCVPQIIVDYGNIKTKAKSLPHLSKYMIGSIKEMKKTYNELYDQPSEASKVISQKDLKAMIDYAKKLGASHVGFAAVDPSDIFDDKVILYPNAIVISMEMNHEIIKTVPSKNGEIEIFRTYYELCSIVNKIKRFLNERGYNAEAGPSLGGEVNYPLLAEKANIGIIGKHGMLITPDFGPSLRLAAVYTDVENLPISQDNEHKWVRTFCDSCNRCVKKCPGQAIMKEPIVYEDGSLRCIDYKKCAVPFSTQNGCTVCIKECAFFKGDYNKMLQSVKKIEE